MVESLPEGEPLRREQAAQAGLLHVAITFRVHGDREGTERIFPFDLVPRIIRAAE